MELEFDFENGSSTSSTKGVKVKSSFVKENTTIADIKEIISERVGQTAMLESQIDPSFKEGQEVEIVSIYPHFVVVKKGNVHTSVSYSTILIGHERIEFLD